MDRSPWSVRYKYVILAVWVVLVGIAAPLAVNVTHNLTAEGFDAPHSASVWADHRLATLHPQPTAEPQLLRGVTLAQARALATASGLSASWLHPVSGDGVLLLPRAGLPPSALAPFLARLQGDGRKATPVTDEQIGHGINAAAESTLRTSSAVALPILIILLLVVFGSVASAALPLIVALVGSALALGAVDVLEDHIVLSTYLTDIVTFFALGVGVDYALFIGTRFRQALGRGRDVAGAVREAMATAGRSVLFSGIAVALAISTLLIGGTSYWRGLALGGAIAVVAVLLATHTLLPALLGMLGERINWGRLPPLRAFRGVWPALARFATVVPLLAIGLGVVLLAAPGASGPQLSMRVPADLATMLPRHSQLRAASATEARIRGPGAMAPFVIAVDYPGTLTEAATWQSVANLTRAVAALPDVASVASPTSLGVPTAQLAAVVAHPAAAPSQLAAGLTSFVNPGKSPHLVVLYATAKTGPDAPATGTLLGRIRKTVAAATPAGGRSGVGGAVPVLHDFDHLVAARLPWIIGAVALVAFVILFAATGSLWQALLGVAMDALVALATAGLLYLIVQRGSLGLPAQVPNTGVTPLIFVLLFGLSMDYEVILLHRVQEGVHRGLPAARAAREGLALTGSMITGAGLIMAVVFMALLASPLEILQSLAIGMTAAILLDTWIVRTLLVPATGALLGRYAFWPWGRHWGKHVKRGY